MKRLIALLLGGLGLRALLQRRQRPALEASPAAADLRAKLAEARSSGPPPEEPAQDVASRRADVHDRARQAIDELRDEPE